jgi:hypothetical protein
VFSACDLSHFTTPAARPKFLAIIAELGTTAMHLAIENTTWFFAVVGAPYIAESHSDECCDERGTHSRRELEACTPSAGSWLQDDR